MQQHSSIINGAPHQASAPAGIHSLHELLWCNSLLLLLFYNSHYFI